MKQNVLTLLEGPPSSSTYCGPPVEGKFFVQLSGIIKPIKELSAHISRFKVYILEICILTNCKCSYSANIIIY